MSDTPDLTATSTAGTLSAARCAAISYAATVVGLTAPDAAYLALVAPAEVAAGNASAATAVASVSDCVLVRMGIEEAVYQVPDRSRYVFGSAGTLIMHRDADVYVSNPTDLPGPGDGLHWAQSGASVEHFETAIAVDADASTVDVIAGGQRDDAGHETIKQLTRKLVRHGSGWADATNGRVLAGRIDADAMADKYGLRTPA